MGSIRIETFKESIARIKSNARRRVGGDQVKIVNFQRLLSDLKKSNESSGLERSASGKLSGSGRADQLSNLTLGEQKGALKTPALSLPEPLKLATKTPSVSIESVKRTGPTVKIQAPPLDIALPGIKETSQIGVPTAPKLLSAIELPRVANYGKRDIHDIIKTAGKFHGVDPNLTMAVARVESSFNPGAISKDGHESKGLFQLLDTTGREMKSRLRVSESYDPYDPALNSHLGVGYLRRLHDLFSKETTLKGTLKTRPARTAEELEKLAVAAYNAGEGAVARAQARAISNGRDASHYKEIEPHLPSQTRAYVQKVLAFRDAYSAENPLNTTV